MCLGYFFQKPTQKYIPLQTISQHDSQSFRTENIGFYSQEDDEFLKKDEIKYVCLQKDHILLGDHESMKYDYIADMNIYDKNILIMRYFANFDIESRMLKVNDAITTVIIHFIDPVCNSFLSELMKYIKSYQKYDINDKSVKNFKSFLQLKDDLFAE